MRLYLKAAVAASIALASVSCRATGDTVVIAAPAPPPSVPPTALQRCRDPQALPDRDLTSVEATGFWARDRASLRDCETRRAAVTAALARPSQ